MKARKWIIRIAAIVVLIVIGIIMSIIGRGHTIDLDNKTLEYEGQTYKAPYKAVSYTHLDVYKRQFIQCAVRRIAGRHTAFLRPTPPFPAFRQSETGKIGPQTHRRKKMFS